MIDIRKSDEVYSLRLDNAFSKYDVYYIPMYMVRFNVEMIKRLMTKYKEIYLLCHSGKRSTFIKDKYFKEDKTIVVHDMLRFNKLSYGEVNEIILNNDTRLEVKVIGSGSFNVYSIMRITQIILGTMILIIGVYTYGQLQTEGTKNTIPLIILLLLGVNALFNGLTSTCTVSEVFVDYLN